MPAPPKVRTLAALAALLSGCGARTGLGVATSNGTPEAGADAAAMCVTFPPIPTPTAPPPGTACTFGAANDATPALAAIAGDDLVVLTRQGTFTTLFHFDASSSSNLGRLVTSRGDFLGALRVGLPASSELDVELVLVRLDGTVVAHHRESFTVKDFGGMSGVIGNAGGTFAFGAGMGDLGKVWVAVAGGAGTLLGPFDGVALPYGGLYSPRTEPDQRGRFTVLPVSSNNVSSVDWLDPCTGARKPALLPAQGDAVGLGRKLFGVTRAGQLATETADAMTALAHPSLGAQFALWDFAAPYAMFDVPPFPGGLGTTANLLVVNAQTLADTHLSLSYPGLSPVPQGAWLSAVGDSNNPAGFGLDSTGHVTMFLSDATGAIHLEITADGGHWTPLGAPVTFDPVFAPSQTLAFAETGGTYVIKSAEGWQVVRPSAGVELPIAGPGRIAYDGGCVAALVSATELDVVNATNGKLVSLALPSPVDPQAWTSTWLGGDDGALSGP